MTHITSLLKPTLRRGLQIVLFSLALNSVAADTGAAPETVYTTKAGDNVERVVQNAMPNSPLHPNLLRKALADLNPQTVTGKPGQKFKPGTHISLPDHGQLVRNSLAPFGATATETPPRSGYSAGDPASRRNWIRYP